MQPADGAAEGHPAPTIRVVADMDALTAAAERVVGDIVLHAVELHGRATVALAGGGTPRALYERLAADDAARMPWNLVDIWFGDERCVPPDDAESNFHTARETFLERVKIPVRNVRRMEGELGAREAAERYDALLRDAFGAPVPNAPTFDLVLLGVGTEGHTASLFPGHPALDVTDRWAAPVDPAPATAKPIVPRVTLTLPALCGAQHVLVLAAGAEKHEIVRAVREGDHTLPAAMVRGRERTTWLVDVAAAAAAEAER